ncbi:MAG: pseudouridine synthase [Phycisphaerae bacterium]
MQVRLQKFMADCGVASRRHCEEMIRSGQVRVNGEPRSELPVMIDPTRDQVTVGDTLLEPIQPEKPVHVLLYKPRGILVTRQDQSGRKTVFDLIKPISQRLFPVGRLDMDSRGLLLMTNDGELANRLTHPSYGVEKLYIVTVDGKMSPGALEKIRKGAWLGPAGRGQAVRTEGLKIKLVSNDRQFTTLEVRLAEGRNREIRRVLARAGYRVRDLCRVAIAEKLTIKGLSPGEYRLLTDAEVAWLRHASSREYQQLKRDATQQWFERKEMEKERKRLRHTASAAKPAPKAQPRRAQATKRPTDRRRREDRRR